MSIKIWKFGPKEMHAAMDIDHFNNASIYMGKINEFLTELNRIAPVSEKNGDLAQLLDNAKLMELQVQSEIVDDLFDIDYDFILKNVCGRTRAKGHN